MGTAEMQVIRPGNLKDALELLGGKGSAVTPVAVGTDLYVSWHQHPNNIGIMMDLSQLDQLNPLRMT
jgi:CO/xanthine dehydrogenase FAD-binding subunit